MLHFSGRGILLDIEGTTSSVRFVYDLLFPYAARELPAFLTSQWGEPATAKAVELIAKDAGKPSAQDWFAAEQAASADAQRAVVAREIARQMQADLKLTGLKELQGLIWESGFRTGELQAHVYPDVPPALAAWQAAGIDLRIYSSGSIHAQKLFFGYTLAGDLLGRFSGHYDTTIGAKREAASYAKIAAAFALAPAEILFLSDIPAELDAARTAGLATGLLLRPENAPVPAEHGHPAIHSFSEIALVPRD